MCHYTHQVSLPIKNLIVDFSISKQANHTFQVVQVIESFPLCYSSSFFFNIFVVSCLLFAFCLSAFLLPPHFHFRCFPKNALDVFFSLHECRLTRKRRDSAKCFEALGLSLTLILLLLSAAVRLLFSLRRLRLAIHSRPSVPFPWRQHHILRPSHMRLLLRQLHLPLIRCPLQPPPMRQYKTRAFQWLLPQLHILAPVLVLVELICLPQPPPTRQQVVVPQPTPIRH